MPKLSKLDRRNHEAAMLRLRAGTIPHHERADVYSHLRPDATTDIGKGSAFFTPWQLAEHFCIETLDVRRDRPSRIIDLCAGFGVLSLCKWLEVGAPHRPAVTCLDINPEYVAIGRALFPEAEWVQGSVFDAPSIFRGLQFDEFYSNPPFGSCPKEVSAPRFEYAVAEIGMGLSDTGTMIVQQGITDWRYSGRTSFERLSNSKYETWSHRSGLAFVPNCGIDCSGMPFAEANVAVEIVLVERRGAA